jgi:hypothetical protein
LLYELGQAGFGLEIENKNANIDQNKIMIEPLG